VGEFVVIVLGILAALAVDSWSEERNNRILEQEYLARIKEDLEWDLAEIEEAIQASILQGRSATTLLYELNDPLADHVPRFSSDRLAAIDFAVPAHEEFDRQLKRLVWWAARTRSFIPRRSTFDELLATGRIIVVDESELRASIIDHYSLTEDNVTGLSEWVQEPAARYDEFLGQSTGFNAYDFNAIDEPMPLLRDLEGLPPLLRDVRRISLRQVAVLESIEESSRNLLATIDLYSDN
jgi:type II secretory pathway pseudopilin PulG